MAAKKIFPLAVIAIAIGAFAYAMRGDPGNEPQATLAPPSETEAPLPETGATPPPQPPEEDDDDDDKAKLAHERAEEERQAALKKAQEPPEPPPEPRNQRFFKVTVKDAATIETGGRQVQIAGVVAREATDSCRAGDGRQWPCGAVARGALMRLIRGRAVDCDMPPPETPDAGASCKVAGTDITAWLLENGWAEPAEGADEPLQKAHANAKDARRGLYRADAPQVSLTP